jgi:uncharacterized protein YigE (DUF2233 family)
MCRVMKLSRLALAAIAAGCIAVGVAVFSVSRGADREPDACVTRDFEGSRFVVCTYTTRDDLRLVSRDADGNYVRSFEALAAHLGRDANRVRFAMNAGMYNDAGAPIGLYIAEGEQERALSRTDGPGNFHMKPNGVFWQDENGAVHVTATDAYAAEPRAARFATQSGPMLVIDGALHPQFQQDGPSRYLRNGVGVRDERTAYFVISSGVVSFGRFARFFRDELDCDDALFLDGSVSSLWSPQLDRRDESTDLGPMVVVLAR